MIDKHFRLTEEAVEQIGRRDKIRYPTESRFIADAVSAFSEKADNEKEEKELKRLCRKLEGLSGGCRKIPRGMGRVNLQTGRRIPTITWTGYDPVKRKMKRRF